MSFARDLREGLLVGGASDADLARRVLAGMPGAAMPPQHFATAGDLPALLAYVRTLLPADAATRGVTAATDLVATPVPALPDDPERLRAMIPITGPIWLAPVARRPGSVLEASVGAARGATRIAIRVRWHDASADARALDAVAESDAVAVQFVADPDDPAYGMGAPASVSEIWHWAAFRREELAGALDLLEADHGLGPAFVRAEGLTRPLQQASRVTAAGPDDRRVEPGAVAVSAVRDDEHWDVVFVAPRDAPPFDAASANAGGLVAFGVAVWNGSAGEKGAVKSFSGWIRLAPEP